MNAQCHALFLVPESFNTLTTTRRAIDPCSAYAASPSYISLPRALEKEPHNKHLQPSHTNHHQTLNNTEIEDSPLRTPNRAEITILSCTEVFLVSCDSRELA